jgi:hypothetical protein
LQKKRMEEAMEMKRQQENFVDITSNMMPDYPKLSDITY